jgi:hypothetical protein
LELGANRFPLSSVRVGLVFEAQPRNKSSKSGESGSGLFRDSADHHEVCCPIIAYSIYNISMLSEFGFEGD